VRPAVRTQTTSTSSFYPSWVELRGAGLEAICQMVEEVRAIAVKHGLTCL
jgi:hypothetical protein